jgi:hypothetical protein
MSRWHLVNADLVRQDSLYTGADLHQAAEKSRLNHSLHDRIRGIRNAAAILSDVTANRLRRRDKPRFELVIATGTDVDSGDTLTAAYAGSGDNCGWCLSSVFADYEEAERLPAEQPADLQRLLAAVRGKVDVLFVEGVPAGFCSLSGLSFVRMPAWIKQRVRVLESWPAQIDSLRRETRQEAGRFLRKYGFGCSLTRETEDFEHFYDSLYQPYIARRFGLAAHFVERSRFLSECRRGVLLRVTRDGQIPGAALLRPVGRTMAVVWSALDPGRKSSELRGVTDSLDYFSLLYAHLRGFRWLDLGPSRPDLYDGILRYKGKWGAEIFGGLAPQSTISLACAGRSRAQQNFLKRHAFLVRRSSDFQAVFFVDGDTDAAVFAAKLSASMNPGVRSYRVVALSAPGDALREAIADLDADVTLIDASQCPDVGNGGQ